MEQKINSITLVLNKLKKTKLLYISSELATSLFNSLFVGTLLLFLATFAELILNTDRAFRLFLFLTPIITFAAYFGYLSYPIFVSLISKNNKLTLDKLAYEVGQHYPEVKDRLSNSIQLFNLLSYSLVGVSHSFINKSIETVANSVKDYDFNVIINKDKLRKSFTRFLVSTFLFILLCFLLSSSFGFAFYRIVHFNKSFIPPPPYSLIIYPKYQTIKIGDNVEILVKATGTAPQTITLKIKELQQRIL